jgi:hypothetical protein
MISFVSGSKAFSWSKINGWYYGMGMDTQAGGYSIWSLAAFMVVNQASGMGKGVFNHDTQSFRKCD